MITVVKGEDSYQLNNAVVLDPCITEILNGLYAFEFKIPTFADRGNLKVDDLLKVKNIYGNIDAFRVSSIERELGFINVFAYHISYDLADNLIEDINIVNQGADAALKRIQDSCKYKHPFKINAYFSGVIESARIVRMNPLKAILGDDDNSFINRWGGEVIRSGNKITMVSIRGINSGVVIRHKKNLLGYTAEIDSSSVVTSLQPMGADGLQLPPDERFIESPLIDMYANKKVGVKEYTDIKELDPENPGNGGYLLKECYRLLKERAEMEFTGRNRIDIPTAHYTVNFVDLSKTEEYKEFKHLETVHIGDTVKVEHIEDGLEIEARVISYKYNPITEQYLEIELGNYAPSFTDIKTEVEKINNKIDTEIMTALEDAKKTASNLIQNGFGGHVKIYPDRILIMDRENEEDAKRVWQWNKNGFGYSSTGINGEYGLALTMDGSIVADFITSGNLNANVIQSGHILGKNFDLDLDAGLMKFGQGSIDSNTLSPELKEELKGEDGTLEELPAWLKGWDTNKTQIGQDYIISPNLAIGTKRGKNRFEGLMFLNKKLTETELGNYREYGEGLSLWHAGFLNLRIKPDGTGWIGGSTRRISWNEWGVLTLPKIRTEDIEVGAVGDKQLTTISGGKIKTGTITADEINARSVAAATGKYIQITTDKLIPGKNKRIIMESNKQPGDNNCLQIDCNSGDIRLKADSGTYVRVSKNDYIDCYIGGNNVLNIKDRRVTCNARIFEADEIYAGRFQVDGLCQVGGIHTSNQVSAGDVYAEDYIKTPGYMQARSYLEYSDARCKENITPIRTEKAKCTLAKNDKKGATLTTKELTDFIYNAPVFTYNYKDSTLKGISTMTQYIKGPLKEYLVNEEGVFNSVNIYSLIGALHVTVQEQKKEINVLNEKIEEQDLLLKNLEERLEKLERKER